MEVTDFARRSAAVFWEHYSDPVVLPASVSGKLGGPSQRRLPSTLTSAVLQGVGLPDLNTVQLEYCLERSTVLNLYFAQLSS